MKGRSRRDGVEQYESLNIATVFKGVPNGIVPEEIVQVTDAVDVQADVLSQECLNFNMFVPGTCFYGRIQGTLSRRLAIQASKWKKLYLNLSKELLSCDRSQGKFTRHSSLDRNLHMIRYARQGCNY
jgi:hypothetical protein